MADSQRKTPLLNDNPLCGRGGTYKDTLNLANGDCTRKIGKVVFKGTENWYDVTINGVYYTNVVKDLAYKNHYSPMCSHFKLIPQTTIANLTDGSFTSDNNVFFWFKESSITSLADWITYLQQQYSAGTPVTVWYVLATPTTETITVPSGLTGTEEGYLNRSGTPTPTNPIYPTANEVLIWQHSLRKLTTSTDTLTSLPADLYADGNSATVGISGNMEQTGTPTPQNPIQPQETGEMTGNLFDTSTLVDGKGLDTNGAIINYPKRCTISVPINVSEFDDVTISFVSDVSNTRVIYALFNGSTLIRRESAIFSGSSIDVSSGNSLYICFYESTDLITVTSDDLSNIIINSGSTALPYEPYGVKIPISSAGTTTPVYLGEVQTTRKIKKLVLTGEESGWAKNDSLVGSNVFYRTVSGYYRYSGLCTHYATVDSTQATEGVFFGSNINFLTALSDNIDTIGKWETYLQQQYAAGTPVTVWYVLATPTTGIVNEPLRKIGDYADTVSGITVPTITGKDTFDVETSLKPSAVSLNYTGWHDATVKEWDGSQWD